MMKKKERLQIIKQVLDDEIVTSQKDLMTKLMRSGVDVQQSAISRDLKTLNYAKVTDQFGNTRYQPISQMVKHDVSKFHELAAEIMLSVTCVQFMNIVKTVPANGNLLAALIDEQQFADVIATLAGHDAIYITSPNESAAKRVNELLLAILADR